MNGARLSRAKTALAKFDLVLLLETMGSQAEMVADILGVPLHNASLARIATPEQQNSWGNKTKGNLVDDIALHAPKAYELLLNATRFDSLFYEYALSLNEDRYSKWKNGEGLTESRNII